MTKQIRLQRLSEAVAPERRITETDRQLVPGRRTCDRKGPTTVSAEPVTWYGQGQGFVRKFAKVMECQETRFEENIVCRMSVMRLQGPAL